MTIAPNASPYLLPHAAQYGSEAILKTIHEKSGRKWTVHVGASAHGDHLCLQELGACTSADPREAEWIHACSWKRASSSKKDLVVGGDGGGSFTTLPCQTGAFEVGLVDSHPAYPVHPVRLYCIKIL